MINMRHSTTYIKNSIENLRNIGKNNGFKIIYKQIEDEYFSICIYKSRFFRLNSKCLITFNGNMNASIDDNKSFDNCWEQAHNYIINNK